MIKKLIWTLILVSPFIFAGIIAIFSEDETLDIFNSSNAIGSWKNSFKEFFQIVSGNNDGSWGNFLIYLLVASFWTAPFWYCWKGTFFLEIIPFFGFGLRVFVFSLLFGLPGIAETVNWEIIVSNSIYFTSIISIIALIGLWLRS